VSIICQSLRSLSPHLREWFSNSMSKVVDIVFDSLRGQLTSYSKLSESVALTEYKVSDSVDISLLDQ
jgi:hypothetical protein